ncbi:MAG: PAS domain S-box protein [Acidimicrobiia bacterium]
MLTALPFRVTIVGPDADGRWRMAGTDITGERRPLAPETAVGTDLLRAFGPQMVARLEEARTVGHPTRQTTPIEMPDGSVRVVDSTHVPLPDGRIVVFSYDLTEHANEADRAREYTDAVLRASPDGVWVTSRDLTILHYAGPPDPRAPESSIGRNMADVYSPELVARTRELVERTLATGEMQTQVNDDILDPGRMFETRMVPLGPDEVLSVARDVTDLYRNRRYAEQRSEIDSISALLLHRLLEVDRERFAEVAEAALGSLAEVIGADCVILGRRSDGPSIERLYSWGRPSVADAVSQLPRLVPFSAVPISFRKLVEGEPLVMRASEGFEDPRQEVFDTLGSQVALVVPLQTDHDLLAYVSLFWPSDSIPDVDAVLPSVRALGVNLLEATRRDEAERARDEAVENLEHALVALRVSEERFRLMSGATNDVLWDLDLATGAIWWSPGIEAFSGYAARDIEPTIEAWRTFVYPDDVDDVFDSIAAAIAGGARQWAREFRFAHRHGRTLWVLARGEILRDADGRAVRVVGGLRDVTGRRHAEEILRAQARLLDEATDVIYARDLDDRITYWNRSAEGVYGWRADEVLGRTAFELFQTEVDEYRAATAAVLRDGEWAGEFRQRRADGTEVIVEARLTLVLDDDGNPRSVLAINADVTEQRRWEHHLLRSQRMESLGTLAGGIAHDLNNVLAPILMATELLRLDESDPDRRTTLDTIELAAQRGADLVRQVLSFARGVEGEMVVVDVDEVMAELATFMTETFPRSIAVRIVDPAEPLRVAGDPTQLAQVLLNLCVNARDSMPDGGELVIAAERRRLDEGAIDVGVVEDEGDFVVITVSDTGTGIPPALAERIFEPFFTTKAPGLGTGLGLATAIAIVKSHNGVLEFESELGVGTVFSVCLPAAGGGRDAHPSAQDPGAPRGNREVVLVVDDENAVLSTLRQVLRTYGYQVRVSTSGQEAIRMVDEDQLPVDVVLTDLMMPGLDGIETVRAIRALRPDVRIIAMSGVKTDDNVERAAEAGIRHFLAKPYSISTLLTTVRSVLDDPTP